MKSVAPSLAAGNGLVLKPHEHTSITGGTMIAKIFEEAGLPKGLLNVVTTEISEIGDRFVEHPIPRAISFTGSTKVGQHIGSLAGKNLKEVCCLLTPNGPLLDSFTCRKESKRGPFGVRRQQCPCCTG